MNTMKLAHMLRKALNIQGCYRVQMKAALALAWMVKKEQISMEVAMTGNIAIFDKSIVIEKAVEEKIVPREIVTLEDIVKEYSNKRYVAYPTEDSYVFTGAGKVYEYKSMHQSLIGNKNSMHSVYSGSAEGVLKADYKKLAIPAKTLFVIDKDDEERYKDALPKDNSGYEFIVCDCL